MLYSVQGSTVCTVLVGNLHGILRTEKRESLRESFRELVGNLHGKLRTKKRESFRESFRESQKAREFSRESKNERVFERVARE